MTVLQRLGLHNSFEELLHLGSFLVRDHLFHACLRAVVVQQPNKGLVSWTTEHTLVDVRK